MVAVFLNSLLQKEEEAYKEGIATQSPSTQIIAVLGGRTWEKYQSFWCDRLYLSGVKALQNEFQLRPDDIYLASDMKSRTTWTKALLNTILSVTESINLGDGDVGKRNNNRHAFVYEKSPHALVLVMEVALAHPSIPEWDISSCLSPRLLHTHLPFDSFLAPLNYSPHCKIIYIARNPRDIFVLLWKFYNNARLEWFQEDANLSNEAVFDAFCSGIFHGGPFAENILSYWQESWHNPNKVMFLTYKDLQADCVGWVKKMGAFIGCSPTLLEENAKIIVDKCSFESLSSKEFNSRGTMLRGSVFFREGKVGGCKKHFTPEMEAHIHKEIEQTLHDEGLHFTYSITHDRGL